MSQGVGLASCLPKTAWPPTFGILAAIAIPQFAAYREKAYNSAANSDIKNLKTGFESFNADNQVYPAELDQNNS